MNFDRIKKVCAQSLHYRDVNVLYKTATAWALKVFADIENDFSSELTKILYRAFEQKSILQWADLNKSVLSNFNLNLDDWQFNILNGVGPCLIRQAGNDFNHFFILTKTPINFEKADLKVKKEAVLTKTSEIPQLHIYEVNNIESKSSDFTDFDKNLYPYFFLIDFFKNSELTQDASNTTIQNFLIENKNILNNILKFCTQTPKKLGAGVDGTVFDIGNNKVLKIFTDETSYVKALNTIDDLHKNAPSASTEIMMYDLGIIGYFGENNYPIYYYIIEKVITVSSLEQDDYAKIQKIISAIASNIYFDKKLWDSFKNAKLNINSPEVLGKIDDISFSVNSVYKKEIKDLTSSFNLASNENKPEWAGMLKVKRVDDWVSLLIKEIVAKFLSGRGDMHLGNVGITNSGYIRFFDAAHSRWEQGINYTPYFTNSEQNRVVVNDGDTKRV